MPSVHGKDGKKIGVHRFSKTEVLWYVHVDYLLYIRLWVCFTNVLQVKNTQKGSRRTCPIAKSTKLLLFFLIQKLSVAQ